MACVALPIVVGDVSFLSHFQCFSGISGISGIPAIVSWAFFGRLYRVWISYPSVDFSKEKVLELRTGNFEETPRGSSLQRQFLARALSWTRASLDFNWLARKRTHVSRVFESYSIASTILSNPPGSGGAGVEKPSVPGGRVCASRVSRVEARYPLVRVGDCERRCGVGSNSFRGGARALAVFPKHPPRPRLPRSTVALDASRARAETRIS